MRISDEIRVIDLLARRDAEYLHVKACEDAIAAILGPGVSYPYGAPATPLPAEGRTNAKRCWRPIGVPVAENESGGHESKKGKGAVKPGTAADLQALSCNFPAEQVDPELREKLRPLRRPAENAYQVTFRDNGEVKTSFHDNTDVLLAISTMHCSGFEVLSVDSVSYLSPEQITVRENLWHEPTYIG